MTIILRGGQWARRRGTEFDRPSHDMNPERSGLGRELPPTVARGAAFLFYFSLCAMLFARYAYDGFLGDAAAYVAPDTLEYSQHPLVPFLTRQDTGHPAIFAWINGLIWNRTGIEIGVASVSTWFYAALALTSLQELGRRFGRRILGAAAPRWTGLAVALCMFSTPLFVNNVVDYLTELPNLAFMLLMFEAWEADRRGWTAFWAVMASLTRITGCLGVLGLGLLDIWLLRRRGKTLRGMVWLAAPWAISGGIFGLYMAIKLWILNRPLATMEVNYQFVQSGALFAEQAAVAWSHIVSMPRCGIGLWLVPIVWAAAAWGVRRHFLGQGSVSTNLAQGEKDGPSLGAWLAAWGAILAGPALMSIVHGGWPLPRYFLLDRAPILIVGVSALLWLMPRWRGVCALLTAAWCALQIVRWHPDWTANAFHWNRDFAGWMTMLPPLTLQMNDYKRLYLDLAEWAETEGAPKKAIVADYQTLVTLAEPAAGYVSQAGRVTFVGNLSRERRQLDAWMQSAPLQGREVYFAIASFASEDDALAAVRLLDLHPGFAWIESFKGRDDLRIDLFAFRPELERKALAANGEAGTTPGERLASRMARILLGRPARMPETLDLIRRLAEAKDREATAAKAIRRMASSWELHELQRTTGERIDAVFRTMLDRPATDEEARDWARRLDAGQNSIDALIDQLAKEPAFAAVVERCEPEEK